MTFSPDDLSFFDAIAAYKTINCTVFVVGDQAIWQCGISQRQSFAEQQQGGTSLLRAAPNMTNCRR
jgi:hypothetical protein